MKNIILIGFMGSGKSTIGKALSNKTGMPFIDSDEWITKMYGKTISALFCEQGEEFFRNLETKLLQKLFEERDSFILSTGGGMPLQKKNRDLLKRLGTVYYLCAAANTIMKRISKDDSRPLISQDKSRCTIDKMITDRAPCYEEAAQIVIAVDNKKPNEICNEILELFTHDVKMEKGATENDTTCNEWSQY